MEFMFVSLFYVIWSCWGIILSQQDFDEFEEDCWERKKQNQLEGVCILWI